MKELLKKRPKRVALKLEKMFGADNVICLLSGHDVISALRGHSVIVMACNTRIKWVIPGIMAAAQDEEAVVAFELAKSEHNERGTGYTGFTPETYFQTVCGFAHQMKFTMPFFIHGDHITVKSYSESELQSARDLIYAQIKAGYTSFAIDASFNPIYSNIEITSNLVAQIWYEKLGLEVEVGEIKSVGQEGEITSVDEAKKFIEGLADRRIYPDMLAINNGSKHGNYKPEEGVHIDLGRTEEIYEAIRPVVIAQHGITGTPLHLMELFADCGIRKGNVGTEWQNIAHAGLPTDLMGEMLAWAEENGKDIKEATREFLDKINGIPAENQKKIESMAYQKAKEFLAAFRGKKTALIVRDYLCS